MGQLKGVKQDKLDEKKKKILASRELIEDALDLDKKLAKIKDHLKDFDKEMHSFKPKNQKKIRDF